MSGTKFVVVKMKELVKTAVFAVLGVVILAGLIYFFLHLGDDSGESAYRDGTYYAEMELGGETAAVAVTVENGKIADIALSEQSDSVAVFYPLLETAVEEVSREVTKNQSLTIEVSPQNAHSSQLVLDAVAEGLEKAKR